MEIFAYSEYREYIRDLIRKRPKRGRGEIDRMAQYLGVNQSFVSQVLGGQRNFSGEQAYHLSQYLELKGLEVEYFLELVQLAKTTLLPLRELIGQRLDRLRLDAKIQQEPVTEPANLSEQERAVFYSQWYYSAIRLLTAVPELDSLPKIAQHLGLPLERVQEVMAFLLKVRLCTKQGGRHTFGPRRTLIARGTPMFNRHILNWRLRGIEEVQKEPQGALFYSHPMIVSAKDAQWIREKILQLLSEVESCADLSQSEQPWCLNLDWFRF